MTKMKFLLGATALATSALAIAGTASAQTEIYGGGSTLIAPYLNQAENCYGNYTDLVNQGSVISGSGANETLTAEPQFNYTAGSPHNCASGPVDSSVTFNYEGVGSGNGIAGLYSHQAALQWGDTVPGTDGSWYPTVNYAASDAGLSGGYTGSDVDIYINGGVEGPITVVAPGGAASPPTTYPNPLQTYGALIQIPLSVDPVAFVYSPVYEKREGGGGVVASFKFNVQGKNADGSGGLKLDTNAYCAIWNGQLTNFNDPYLTSLNGGVSLEDPRDPTPAASWSVPIEIVGRADSSGTTSIFVRGLAAQCASYTYNGAAGPNAYPAAGSKHVPSTLSGPTWTGSGYTGGTPTPGDGLFTLATGSSGVASYVNFSAVPPGKGTSVIQGRLGYVGPDYALPATAKVGAVQANYGLNVADLENLASGGTTFLEPTGANASAAFGTVLPPQSTSTGAYSAGVTANGLRTNPYDWAQPISTTNSDGTGPNPLAIPADGLYPFVGTTNFLGYTCYADATVAAKIIAFLDYYYTNGITTNPNKGLIGIENLAPLSPAWRTAIVQTFLIPGGGTKALNLLIQQGKTGPAHGVGSQCHTATGG